MLQDLKEWTWAYKCSRNMDGLVNDFKIAFTNGWNWSWTGELWKAQSDLVFYGRPTSKQDRKLYRLVRNRLPKSINEYNFGLACDIITRFVYPQALPNIVPNYPINQRAVYSKHHTETIEELPIKLRSSVYNKFILPWSSDYTAMDIGAYLGYGSIGITTLLDKVKVIAWECNPSNLKIFRQMVEENTLKDRITIIDKAAWNKTSKQTLGFEDYQEKSLVYGRRATGVETDTIDNVVKELDLQRLDFISMTINGAEPEALLGGWNTIKQFKPSMSITGWVKVNGQPVWKRILPILDSMDYKYIRMPKGRVLAWAK